MTPLTCGSERKARACGCADPPLSLQTVTDKSLGDLYLGMEVVVFSPNKVFNLKKVALGVQMNLKLPNHSGELQQLETIGIYMWRQTEKLSIRYC